VKRMTRTLVRWVISVLGINKRLAEILSENSICESETVSLSIKRAFSS